MRKQTSQLFSLEWCIRACTRKRPKILPIKFPIKSPIFGPEWCLSISASPHWLSEGKCVWTIFGALHIALQLKITSKATNCISLLVATTCMLLLLLDFTPTQSLFWCAHLWCTHLGQKFGQEITKELPDRVPPGGESRQTNNLGVGAKLSLLSRPFHPILPVWTRPSALSQGMSTWTAEGSHRAAPLRRLAHLSQRGPHVYGFWPIKHMANEVINELLLPGPLVQNAGQWQRQSP